MLSAWRRFREYLSRHGPAKTFARLLTSTVYRRLVLFEMPLAEMDPDFDTGVPFELRPLAPGDVEAVAAARSDLAEDEVRARLARGDRCAVGRSDGEVVYHCWWTTSRFWIPYLAVHVPLEEGEVYVYDAWVSPALRRKRIGLAASSELAKIWRAEGSSRLIGTIEPENTAALGTHGHLPTRYLGRIVSVGLGRARVSFRRP